MTSVSLSDDLLHGGEEIAAFVYGDRRKRRAVYHLAETAKLPVFRIGAIVCARKSSLMTWIAEQERLATKGAA